MPRPGGYAANRAVGTPATVRPSRTVLPVGSTRDSVYRSGATVAVPVMRKQIRQALAIVGCVGVLALLAPHASDGGARQTTTFKNIKVFDGLTDEQIDDAMMYMRGSLGVQCEHCQDHKDWSRDDKEPKRTARQMIRMVRRSTVSSATTWRSAVTRAIAATSVPSPRCHC
jgi:hypothetical protein